MPNLCQTQKYDKLARKEKAGGIFLTHYDMIKTQRQILNCCEAK
jgi:hypothetical protein